MNHFQEIFQNGRQKWISFFMDHPVFVNKDIVQNITLNINNKYNLSVSLSHIQQKLNARDRELIILKGSSLNCSTLCNRKIGDCDDKNVFFYYLTQ